MNDMTHPASNQSLSRVDGVIQGDSTKLLSFSYPLSFTAKETGSAAWAAWYGSNQKVASIVELLAKARISALGDSRSFGQLQPWQLLSSWFSNPVCVEAITKAVPEADSKVFPQGRIHNHLQHLVGDKLIGIKALVEEKPITDVANAVIAALPVGRTYIDQGIIDRDEAASLLILLALAGHRETLPLGSPDRFRCDMAMECFLTRLEDSPWILLFSKELHECAGARVEEGDVEPKLPRYCEQADELPKKLIALERSLLVARPDSHALSNLAWAYIENSASVKWERLIEALTAHSVTVEMEIDSRALPRDLFAVKLPALQPTAEGAQLLRDIISRSCLQTEPDAFDGRAQKRLAGVRGVQMQIQRIGNELTAGGMLKLAELAERGRDEILASREWFAQELKTYEAEAQLWKQFFTDWSALSRTEAAGRKNAREPENVQKVEAPSSDSKLLDDLRGELAKAVERNDVVSEELKVARAEVHRLKLALESKQALQSPTNSPAVDTALLHRVVTRKGLSPTDVLAYIEHASPDRVEILDSAWKSAKAAEHYAYPERMLELLDILVNPYFESLAAGNPDAVAREVFGNAYSAKESKTTLATHRLRAKREFDYRGKKLVFEKHLRVGGGVGARECMRIYFQIIDGKVVIAYAGEHLEVITTN